MAYVPQDEDQQQTTAPQTPTTGISGGPSYIGGAPGQKKDVFGRAPSTSGQFVNTQDYLKVNPMGGKAIAGSLERDVAGKKQDLYGRMMPDIQGLQTGDPGYSPMSEIQGYRDYLNQLTSEEGVSQRLSEIQKGSTAGERRFNEMLAGGPGTKQAISDIPGQYQGIEELQSEAQKARERISGREQKEYQDLYDKTLAESTTYYDPNQDRESWANAMQQLYGDKLSAPGMDLTSTTGDYFNIGQLMDWYDQVNQQQDDLTTQKMMESGSAVPISIRPSFETPQEQTMYDFANTYFNQDILGGLHDITAADVGGKRQEILQMFEGLGQNPISNIGFGKLAEAYRDKKIEEAYPEMLQGYKTYINNMMNQRVEDYLGGAMTEDPISSRRLISSPGYEQAQSYTQEDINAMNFLNEIQGLDPFQRGPTEGVTAYGDEIYQANAPAEDLINSIFEGISGGYDLDGGIPTEKPGIPVGPSPYQDMQDQQLRDEMESLGFPGMIGTM